MNSAALAANIDNQRTPRGRRAKARSYLYDQIIDYMFANPGATYVEIAEYMKKSTAWVGYILRSDSFKQLYAARRQEKNTRVAEAVSDRLNEVALRALDHVNEKMRENPAAVSLKAAADIADKSLQRLGYGVSRVAPGTAIFAGRDISLSISPEVMSQARERIREIEHANGAETAPAKQQSVIAPRQPSVALQQLIDIEDAEELPVEMSGEGE